MGQPSNIVVDRCSGPESPGPALLTARVADVWANHWPPAFFDAYPPMQRLYDRVGITERASLDDGQLLVEMAEAGVERAVVSATAVAGWDDSNLSVIELCSRDPDRLVACASVDPRRGMAAVADLRNAVGSGAVALKLLPFLYDLPPNDRVYYPLYAACVELDIPVLILTGHTAVTARNDVGRPGHLDDVALFFEELTIIAGHAGYPWTEELIGLAWKHDRLFIDTSGHRPRHFPAPLVQFIDTYGRNKVLFGSGYPMIPVKTLVDDALGLGLRQESLECFLWANAAGIWGWS
ncbi:MAG: amidohydrolase family protein [Acidimicrobiales bacterium]